MQIRQVGYHKTLNKNFRGGIEKFMTYKHIHCNNNHQFASIVPRTQGQRPNFTSVVSAIK